MKNKIIILFFLLLLSEIKAQNNSLFISKNFAPYLSFYDIYSVGYLRDSINKKRLCLGAYFNIDISQDPSKKKLGGITLIMPFKFNVKKINIYTGSSIKYLQRKWQYSPPERYHKIEYFGIGLYAGIGFPIYKKIGFYTDANVAFARRIENDRMGGNFKTLKNFSLVTGKLLSFAFRYRF